MIRPALLLTRFNHRDCMTSSTFTTSAPVRALVFAFWDVCAWAVSLRHPLQTRTMSDSECAAEGLPFGTEEECSFAMPMAGSPWWHVDAWDDGECFNLRVLGWSVEVYHQPRQVAPAVA